MLTSAYNIGHTRFVPSVMGERLKELIRAAGYTQKSLAKAIRVNERSVGNWIKSGRPPRDPADRARLTEALGQDVWDTRPQPDPEDVDNLTELRFLDATPAQHAERLARMLAREEAQRERHDQSNVVPVDWTFEDVPLDSNGALPNSPLETSETLADGSSLLDPDAESADHPPAGNDSSA